MTALGRRLPPGARFELVTDLYDMAPEDVEHTMIWCGGGGASWSSGWMRLESLVRRPPPLHETNLSMVPSTLVVVVRDDRVST